MTYLEAVNQVLQRLREDTVTDVTGLDDPVAEMVTALVNDAKQLVENAHTWNALRDEWSITTAADDNLYSLTNAGNYGKIELIVKDDGVELLEEPLRAIRKRQAASPANSKPKYYAVNGVDASGDIQLQLYPKPDNVYNYTVYGFKRQAELSSASDVLLVPAKPVVYYALAMAARERGEVGGQTAAELFALANVYLSDAIAWDASLNDQDNVWMTV
jgi:hypothetical protein